MDRNIKRGISSKWLVMTAVSMGVFLATIDGSIVNVALPTLVKALNVDFAIIEWVVLAYLLTVTTLLLSIGRLADMIGKKRIYATGFVIFTLGSMLCGVSNNIVALIAFRVFQAVGAAMMMALGTAIVTEAFPPEERGKALGITGTIVSIGVISGPTIGGVILESLPWNWLFFVNIPIGILGIFLVMRYVPSIKPVGGERFDFLGAGVLFICLLSLLMGLSISQQIGFNHPLVYGILLVGFILIPTFIFIEKQVVQPMIDLSLFTNRLFSINLVTGFMAFIAGSGTILLMPFYLENILGFPPRTIGLLLGVVPLIVGIIAPFSGALSDKTSPRTLTAIGLFLLALGYAGVATLDQNTDAFGFALRYFLVGVGLGFFQSPNNSAIMGTAPKNRLGIASGLLSLTRTLGQITGISILGAIWTARVNFHAGVTEILDATQAPLIDQVAGLQDTIRVVVVLVSLAFVLSLWAVYEVQTKKKTAGKPARN